MNVSDCFQKNLLLFVAGLPSRSTPEQVLNFLETFGKVKLLRLRSTKTDFRLIESNPQNNIRRGFCVVETFDNKVYEAILKQSGVEFQGRNLIITHLRGKQEFQAYVSEIERRRLLISHVPPQIPLTALQLALESRFGPVKKLTRQDLSFKNKETPSQKLFLVEFLNQSSSYQALQVQKFLFSFEGENSELLFSSPPSKYTQRKFLRSKRKWQDQEDVDRLDYFRTSTTQTPHGEKSLPPPECQNNSKEHFWSELELLNKKPNTRGYHAFRRSISRDAQILSKSLDPAEESPIRFNILVHDKVRR